MARDSNTLDSDTRYSGDILLEMLSAVEQDSHVTQRTLARNLGIALGLANAYLKRAVKKGFIKVTQAPANRYAYYLTPSGFREKSRLTTEFFYQSFRFFRESRTQCRDLYDLCLSSGWKRIALIGISDLAEIAIMSAGEYPLSIIGVLDVDGDYSDSKFSGLAVKESFADLGRLDAVIITDLKSPSESFNSLREVFPEEKILVFPLLGIRPRTENKPGSTPE